MEYVDGTNLRQQLRSGLLPAGEALRILGEACDALEFAHGEGVVHRDVKPENILLDKKARVKVADFGLAKLLGRRATDYTLTGPWQAMGTLHYMAPEQLEDPLRVDRRADVYSLGVVLYEMLTGQLPLGRFAPPSQKAAVDPRLDEVVLRALERDPERRFAGVDELRAAVEAVTGPVGQAGRSREAAPARPEAPGPQSPPMAPTERVTPVPALDPAREAVRRPVRMAGLGLVAFGALGLLTALGISFLWALGAFEAPRSPWFRGQYPRLTFGEIIILWCLFAWPVGVVSLLGGLQMIRVRSYGWSVVAAVAAILPVSPVNWYVGLPVGLWALWVLRRPAVKAEFRVTEEERKATGAGPDGLDWLLGTPAGWVVLVCGIGLVASLPTWQQPIEMAADPPRSVHRGDPSGGRIMTWSPHEGREAVVWPGAAAAGCFLVLLVLHLGTSLVQPEPVWRPLATVAAGLAVLLCMALYRNYEGVVTKSVQLGTATADGRVISSQQQVTETQYRLPQPAAGGAYLCLGLGLALIVLGSLDLRHVMAERQRRKARVRAPTAAGTEV
jgi:hypothetical protein